jgi:hypothetical protein
MAFSDSSHDLDQLISSTMGNAFEGARRALAEEIRRHGDAERRETRNQAFRVLRDACSRLDATSTQVELLSALVEEAGRFASRSALLLTFTDGVRGWAAYGFDGADVENLALGYDQPALASLAAGRGTVTLDADNGRELARRLGGAAPLEGVLVPLVLRDRVAAALYADRLRPEDDFAPEALQILAFAAAEALELQGQRQRAGTPTLRAAEGAAGGEGLPLWDAAAAANAAAAPALPAPATSRDAVIAPTPAPYQEPPAAPYASQPAVEEPLAPPELPPAPWEEPVWQAPASEEPAADEAASEAGVPTFAEPSTEWSPAAEPATAEPAWSVEEAPALEEAPASSEPSWSYDPAVEEVAAEPLEEAATPELETYADAGAADEVEEIGATAVEELPAEPAAEEPAPWYRPAAAPPPPPNQTSPYQVPTWQGQSPVTPPESTTTPLYPESPPAYSEATVRISRELLPQMGEPPAAPPAADASEDATVMLDRTATPPPPEPPISEVEQTRPTRAVPEPAARPSPLAGLGGGTTEVQAPPDLEGPGWAFRAEGMPAPALRPAHNEETSALHEEARRLARLLVSEIKLYNEEQVEEGRRHRDIYPRLQDDIDRSRQMYEERVDPRVRDEVDYFELEMVNILAAGDSGALGI